MGIKGDIRIAVYHARNFIGGKMSAIKMFQFCFNTSFMDPEASSIRLPKSVMNLNSYQCSEINITKRFLLLSPDMSPKITSFTPGRVWMVSLSMTLPSSLPSS